MKLYLVRGNDVDGENQDLFVVAETPKRAIDIWNLYCIQQEWTRDDGDEFQSGSSFTPSHVREILDDVTGTMYDGQECAVEWDDLPVVA